MARAASSYDDFAVVDACSLPRPVPQSLTGSGFLATSGPPRPAPHPADEWAFVECSHNFVVNTASVTDEGDDGFAPAAPLNGQLMCDLCADCTMDAHEGVDGRLVPGHAVYICEGCQRGCHSYCIRDRVSQAAALPDHGLSDVSLSDPSVVQRRSTWRCGDCVEDDQWGVRSLVESMLTFSNTQCSATPAT